MYGQINSLGQGPCAGGDGLDGLSSLLTAADVLVVPAATARYQNPTESRLGWQLGRTAGLARGSW